MAAFIANGTALLLLLCAAYGGWKVGNRQAPKSEIPAYLGAMIALLFLAWLFARLAEV
jgi:hypothetical protein